MLKTADDIRQLNEKISHAGQFTDKLKEEIGHVIIGQHQMLDRLLIGLLSNGHILLEGVPGLAKTLSIKSLSQAIHAKFSRIQFTPDLLPADVIGTLIYNQQRNEFVVRKGPIFANFILADEINRAPAKVQSALLEAMQERQVTIGDTTYKLDEPFLVLATQNPLEQEGTYPLPEALASKVEDNGGVYLVPAFTGLGAPYWNQHARGTIVGITRGSTDAHIARAAVESIAFQSMDLMQSMEADAGLPIKEVRVDGGATINNQLMQFQSDIIDTNVIRPMVTETTALGAAYLAGLAVGFWKDINELQQYWQKDKAFSPSMTDEKRNDLQKNWKKAVRAAQAWTEE